MATEAAHRLALFIKQASTDTHRRLAVMNALVLMVKAAQAQQLEARLVKAAAGLGLGGVMKRFVSNTVGRPFTSRVAGQGMFGGARKFSPVRTSAVLGGAGLGLGAAHAHEAAKDTVGLDANPFTWGRGSIGRAMGADQGPTEEDVFSRNQAGYDRASAGIRGQMNDALGTPEYDKLNEQFQRGDFQEDTGWNPLNWCFGGLNAAAPASSGKYYQQRMLQQQKGMQGKYDAMMGKIGPQPGDQEAMQKLTEQLQTGDLLPQQARVLQQHLDVLKKRMGQTPGVESPEAQAIRARMEGSGMRFRGAGPKPSPSAYSQPRMAGMKRPQGGGYATGQAMMPHDYRPMDQWASVFNNG